MLQLNDYQQRHKEVADLDRKAARLVHIALLTALCAAATLVIPIPTVTGGYLNAGDIVIVMTALLAGPLYASAAGGIGSALADLLAGYTVFAPASLIAKGLAGCLIGWMWKSFSRTGTLRAVFAAVCGESVMVLVYFLFEAFVLRLGMGAAAEIPANLLQAASGVIGGIAFYHALYRIPRIRTFSDEALNRKKQ